MFDFYESIKLYTDIFAKTKTPLYWFSRILKSLKVIIIGYDHKNKLKHWKDTKSQKNINVVMQYLLITIISKVVII